MASLSIERIFMVILGILMLFVMTLIFLILSGQLSGQEVSTEGRGLELTVEGQAFDHNDNFAIVRTGRQGDYGRIVFDWREPGFIHERLSGDLLSISFFDTTPINVSNIRSQLHDFVADASTRTFRNHIHVDLKLRGRIATAVSQWDDLVVVDMVEIE